MIARTLRVQLEAERIDAVLAAYREVVRPIHARSAGLRQHYVLVDRKAGMIEIIGIWESAAGLAAAVTELEPAREQLWRAFDVEPPVESWSVADELR